MRYTACNVLVVVLECASDLIVYIHYILERFTVLGFKNFFCCDFLGITVGGYHVKFNTNVNTITPTIGQVSGSCSISRNVGKGSSCMSGLSNSLYSS